MEVRLHFSLTTDPRNQLDFTVLVTFVLVIIHVLLLVFLPTELIMEVGDLGRAA